MHMTPIPENQGRILVVDDAPAIQKLVKRSLEAAGYDTAVADSGEAALHFLEARPFNIVITDIVMPGMSGIELAKKIIQTQAADVIIMTGKVYDYNYDEMIAMGAGDFIQKPFSPDEIVLRVGRIIREQNTKEELDRIRKEFALSQKLEAVGQLSAGIAHEINTPVQYIGDNAAFIRDGYQDLDRLVTQLLEFFEAAKAGTAGPGLVARTEAAIEAADVEFLREEFPGAVEQTLEGVKRISDIVRAIKVFSHPGEQTHTPVNLNRNIETVVLISRNEWKYTADLDLDLDPDLPEVTCDAGQINQVLLNLIINASHAVSDRFPAAGGKKGRIGVGSQGLENRIRIWVRDNGHGIPEAVREKIFDPFFTTKPAGRGTGQGLSIARNIVENRHGGKLQYSTGNGDGTRFTLELPKR